MDVNFFGARSQKSRYKTCCTLPTGICLIAGFLHLELLKEPGIFDQNFEQLLARLALRLILVLGTIKTQGAPDKLFDCT